MFSSVLNFGAKTEMNYGVYDITCDNFISVLEVKNKKQIHEAWKKKDRYSITMAYSMWQD